MPFSDRPPSLEASQGAEAHLALTMDESTKPRKRQRTRPPKQNTHNAALHSLRDHLFADGQGERGEQVPRIDRGDVSRARKDRKTSETGERTQDSLRETRQSRRLKYRAAPVPATEVDPRLAASSSPPSPTGRPTCLPSMDPPVLSFYGAEPVPLPSRFAQIKRNLAHGHRDALKASWLRLLAALEDEAEHIRTQGAALIPEIAFADIATERSVSDFRQRLQTCGVGVIRSVVSPDEAAEWVTETKQYLEPDKASLSVPAIKPPPPQDPTCFDYFWSPAQVRSRAHPNVLRAMQFVMGFWQSPHGEDGDENKANEPPRLSTRFPIIYADRIRIHVGVAEPITAPPKRETLMAQVDGGSLERWEPDGYGRGGTYDCIFRGRWEEYDPWDPIGRVDATPDLYNGAGACSIFRMFQGLLALTDVAPGVVRLMPSPKLATAYFLLRPFFVLNEEGAWELDDSTIIHGAVPGHAQRVTELWHPHLQLDTSLVALPRMQPGDYVVWHCDTAYTIGGDSQEPVLPAAVDPISAGTAAAPMIVYLPACPLTQTNALYLARQRNAFRRGHPGPDFDVTGTGLGSEAERGARLGEEAIGRWGHDGLRGMGLHPWPTTTPADKPLSATELEVVRLANIILFPNQYEFFMSTRHNSPDR